MKRKIVIATVAAAAVIGTGAVSAAAIADDDVPQAQHQSSVQLSGADDNHAADRDDDDADDRADDRDDAGDRDDDGRDDDGRGDDRDKDDARAAKAASTDAQEAIAAALKAVPGTVTEVELDADDGSLTWEIDLLGKDGKWHNLDVDPGNGKILHQHTDRAPEGADHGQQRVLDELKGAKADAADAAQKAAGQGIVTSVDLEDDNGRLGTVWEVDAVTENGSERHLAVDVTSGKVTQLTDDDSDDDHGSDDDSDDSDDHDDHDGKGSDDHDDDSDD